MKIQIAQDEAADAVLSADPFALLVGMLLDQQFPMERAFQAPQKILERFGTLDPARVAAADPEEFKELCSQTPAIHRFPGSMAAKVQEVARIIADEYDGGAAKLWTDAADGRDFLKRMQALPGFGKQKAQIFVALVAKQVGVQPTGWEKAAGDYALEGHRSVADVTDADSLLKVREFKQAAKAAAK